MGLQKRKRIVNEELLALVRTLPCMACPCPSPDALEEARVAIELGHMPPISEAHHVTTRGAGGDDVAENVMPLCRNHHREWHMRPEAMIRKYPSVLEWLRRAGRTDVIGDGE